MTFQLKGEPVETGGREDRLLPWDRVRDVAGISRTTAWRMQQTGDFPTPVPVSPGRVAWWESELTAWKSARSAAKPLAPASRPRLPGMPRRAPVRTPQALPAPHQIQPAHESAPPSEGVKGGSSRRRPRSPDLNQIDFGF